MTVIHLKQVLDKLYAHRPIHHLHHDPISFVHRYRAPADQEVAAIIASSFAYGNITIILRTLNSIFSRLDPSPRHFIEHFEVRRGVEMFRGFKHRFNDEYDLCALLLALRTMVKQNGSLNTALLNHHNPQATDITETLNGFSRAVIQYDYGEIWEEGIPSASFRFLFPQPASGSACKRLCMLLRWMVRHEDGIDLGNWPGINPAQLIIPVDTHISRIASLLGLTTRKQADWAMARQITSALRELDPADPVKYDFALAHLGISDGCNPATRSACPTCQITDICPQGVTQQTKKHPGN